MITEKDLHEAIAECQGVRNPNANTCIKLASYFTILDHMGTSEESIVKSNDFFTNDNKVSYYGDTDFLQMIEGMDTEKVLKIMDELMSTLQVVNPRLYASVIRKLEGQ